MLTRGVFTHLDPTHLTPHVELVAPRLDAGALVAIALPLFIVTMTSQNIPGIAVLGSFGYRLRMREPLLYSGAASAVGALAGGHAINLAAISAALAAGPEAGPDRDRRWIAGVSCGLTYLSFAPLVGVVVAVATAAPPGIVETIAGLALLATFASSMFAVLADPAVREPAAMAIVVAASGITIAGIGAAFWALLAGLVLHAVLTRRPA